MTKKITLTLLFLSYLFSPQFTQAQGIGINENGGLPDPKAILDISSSSKGMLIPRLTTAQRDAIESPPVGLQIYNLTTNTIDVFGLGIWESVSFINGSNVVKVNSLSDLPAPQGDAIILDANKNYTFSGIVDISPYYININGAGLKGAFADKDGVSSNVNGAVLRSSGKNVFMKDVTVVTLGGSTKAYDFSDDFKQKECSIADCRVKQRVPGLGVGKISGFAFTTVLGNFWNCSDGLKLAGTAGHFVMSHNRISGLSTGSGLEFLAGLDIEFINIADNEFDYAGYTGVALNSGVIVFSGRMTGNEIDEEVGTALVGFDSFTSGWHMSQNTRISDSRGYGYIYMSQNATPTVIPAANTYVKIAGTTTAINLETFTAPVSNRFVYTDPHPINASISVNVGGLSPANSTDISIAVAKNGLIIPQPSMTFRELANNQSFILSMETDIAMAKGDFIEVFIKNGDLTNSIVVKDMQVTIRD